MATQAEILADVRARLDEATPRFWEDAELRRWINEAARDIARRAEVLQTSVEVEVTAGDNEYTLSADVVRIYRALWQGDGDSTQVPLDYHDFNSLDQVGYTWTNAQGYPSVFTLWGYPPQLSLVLYPKPTMDGTVTLYYYRFPTVLALDGSDSGDTVDVPNGWDDLIATYCEYMALRKDADPRWQEAKQLYETSLGEMVERTRRWSDQAGAIQHNGATLPGWLWSADTEWW